MADFEGHPDRHGHTRPIGLARNNRVRGDDLKGENLVLAQPTLIAEIEFLRMDGRRQTPSSILKRAARGPRTTAVFELD
ncbi:hypothetical protein RJJ65_25840 [Rhizobium hidalgonense]|uniref:Uncharacterized protein n=1 Tax=Rhizobium hidalgonense TaxID=1538159 RepID=A0AAJ2GZ33_9HYPH|nr:hypothetical protein [Rhizobium hidalgonense]MDR9776022.1 hypothetical protein [Rhizobium hidalgonense]MDR9814087.1 hypothetical protein [Rhizobium hidalgonense]MDR9820829.1 hypothetical protein [Rhizobium hidalgonense]